VLPEYNTTTGDGFRPEDGPWIVLQIRGGNAHAEAPIIAPSVQVRVWAGPEQFLSARARYLQVFDLIHGATSVDFDVDGHVILCVEEVQGQDITDPDTGYASVISFFELRCRSN
jgi:hypothetical protein